MKQNSLIGLVNVFRIYFMRSCEKRSRQFQKYKKDRYSFEQDHASMIKNHVRRKTIFPIPTHLIKTYFEFKKKCSNYM